MIQKRKMPNGSGGGSFILELINCLNIKLADAYIYDLPCRLPESVPRV